MGEWRVEEEVVASLALFFFWLKTFLINYYSHLFVCTIFFFLSWLSERMTHCFFSLSYPLIPTHSLSFSPVHLGLHYLSSYTMLTLGSPAQPLRWAMKLLANALWMEFHIDEKKKIGQHSTKNVVKMSLRKMQRWEYREKWLCWHPERKLDT